MNKTNQNNKHAEALYNKEFWQNFLPTPAIQKTFVALLRMLTSGEPITVEQVAAEANVKIDEVKAFLDKAPVEWDDQHRVIGFGITRTPTDHGYEVNGRKLYVWCAGDALVFPVITGKPAHITSVCHVTGKPITVDVTPEKVTQIEPATSVVSSVPWKDIEWGKVVQLLCSNTHFFATEETAQEWVKKHPGSAIVPVASQFETQRSGIRATLGELLTKQKGK